MNKKEMRKRRRYRAVEERVIVDGRRCCHWSWVRYPGLSEHRKHGLTCQIKSLNVMIGPAMYRGEYST